MFEVIIRNRYQLSVSKTCFNLRKPGYHPIRKFEDLILRPCYFLDAGTSDVDVVEEDCTYHAKSE